MCLICDSGLKTGQHATITLTGKCKTCGEVSNLQDVSVELAGLSVVRGTVCHIITTDAKCTHCASVMKHILVRCKYGGITVWTMA